jgi:hypothetical protein
MSTDEIFRYIFSFLGGGFVVGILDWFKSHYSEKKARKVSALQAQIQNLYAPLQFFSSQNEIYFDRNKKIIEAYRAEYEGKNWSHNERTQSSLEKETTHVFDRANAYIEEITGNNENIIKILRDNYAYIDPEDIEVFTEFMTDYARWKIEVKEACQAKIPFRIQEHLGELYFMRPEFINRVKQKFNAKKKALDSLTS